MQFSFLLFAIKNVIIKIYVIVILLAVLCGRETCFLTVKEEDRLRVFENWC